VGWGVILNWLRYLLGSLSMYAGLFLYEDEEGRCQNRIEKWSVTVRNRGISARSVAAAFMAGVASLTTRAFDRVFGAKLLSFRSLGVSVCFSTASLFISLEVGRLVFYEKIKPQPSLGTAVAGWLIVASAVFLAFVPALIAGEKREKLWLRIWGLGICADIVRPTAEILYFVRLLWGYGSVLRITSFIVFLLGFSFGCDLLYIALTRWMLRVAASRLKLSPIVGLVGLDLVLGVLLCLGPFFLGLKVSTYTYSFHWPRFLGMAGVFFGVLGPALNSVDLIACSLFLVLLSFILLHLLFWPVIERPLYATARYGVIKNKKLLLGAGVALLFGPKGVALVKWFLLRQ
jgi:hypothetical protein